MAIEREGKLGKLNISTTVISELAGSAAVECYGIVGMVGKKVIRDGITDLLNKENYSKGVDVTVDKDKLVVDIYVVMAYGLKISEIALEVQKKIKYILETTLDVEVQAVNVHVQDVKVVG